MVTHCWTLLYIMTSLQTLYPYLQSTDDPLSNPDALNDEEEESIIIPTDNFAMYNHDLSPIIC